MWARQREGQQHGHELATARVYRTTTHLVARDGSFDDLQAIEQVPGAREEGHKVAHDPLAHRWWEPALHGGGRVPGGRGGRRGSPTSVTR